MMGAADGGPTVSHAATSATCMAPRFLDAFRSASRFARSVCPHREHRWLVYAGSTYCTYLPCFSALYWTNPSNCAKLHPWNLLRCSALPALMRCRMSVRSSSTTRPHPRRREPPDEHQAAAGPTAHA